MMKWFLCQILLLVGMLNGFAQVNLPVLSPMEMQEDFTLFRHQLEKYHTGLYENTSKSDFDAVFAEKENTLNQPMNVLEFYRFLTSLHPNIGNGHTVIQPASETLDSIFIQAKFFPLAVVYLQEKLYVLRNNSEDSTLEMGSEILTINGKPTATIVDKMISHLNRDGQNETGPIRDAMNSFNLNYYLYVEAADSFALEIKNPSKQFESYKIAALSVAEVRKNRIQRYGKAVKKSKEKAALSLKFVEEKSAAILKIASFNGDVIKRGDQNYKKFLETAFAEIEQKKVQKLILDLRGNGGGDDGKGPLLYSYLAKNDFLYGKEVLANTKKIDNPKDFEKSGLVRMYNFLRFFTDKKQKDGTVKVPKNKSFGNFSPKENAFTGQLIVLIDGGCFSAAGEFAGCVRHYQRGIFIGKESAGSALKNTSGVMLWFSLPNSKIRILLPLYQYALAFDSTFSRMECVKPDLELEQNFEQYLKKEDVVLQKALTY